MGYVPSASDSGSSNLVARDTSGNFISNHITSDFTATATAAGTTTLTVDSTEQQFFTGSTTQTVTLPVVSTLSRGLLYKIVNLSSGVVTVQSSGANTLQAMDSQTILIATCILLTGTGTASWSWTYVENIPTGGIVTLDGNSGSATGDTVTITTGASNRGTPTFTGSGSTVTLDWNGTGNSLVVGDSAGNITSGLVTGFGNSVFSGGTPGGSCAAFGYAAMASGGGEQNSAFGRSSLGSIGAGTRNTCLGYNSGSSYTGTESSNVLIGSAVTGTLAESNTLRIGSGTGSAANQLDTAIIHGINGVASSNKQIVTIDSSTSQLGADAVVDVANGGTGVATLTGLALGSGTSNFTGVTYTDKTSFTPTVTIGGASTGITYASSVGRYARIGNIVFFEVQIALTSKGSLTGDVNIGNLPVTSLGTPGNFFTSNCNKVTLSTGYTYLIGIAGTSSNSVKLFEQASDGSAQQIIQETNIANDSGFQLGGFYFV